MQSIRWVLILAIGLFATSGLRAEERTVWKHSLGSYVKVGDGKWEERDKNGVTTFTFKELKDKTTDEYVHLYDGKRGAGVKLYKNECHYRENNKDSKWGKLYDGKWVN